MIKYFEAVIYLKNVDPFPYLPWSITGQTLWGSGRKHGIGGSSLFILLFITVPYTCATGVTSLYVFTPAVFVSVFT
jgi:hypothetical protein